MWKCLAKFASLCRRGSKYWMWWHTDTSSPNTTSISCGCTSWPRCAGRFATKNTEIPSSATQYLVLCVVLYVYLDLDTKWHKWHASWSDHFRHVLSPHWDAKPMAPWSELVVFHAFLRARSAGGRRRTLGGESTGFVGFRTGGGFVSLISLFIWSW